MTSDGETGNAEAVPALVPAQFFHFFAAAMDYPNERRLTPDHWNFLRRLLEDISGSEETSGLPGFDAIIATPEILQIEYTRLFINAAPGVVAPPYGSVYLDADGMLYGRSAEKVRWFYRQSGYDLACESDIPDHLLHELRFLALLLENGREAEAEFFLVQYFRPWFAKFHTRVLEDAGHPYYRVLVQLIHLFTREEKAYDC